MEDANRYSRTHLHRYILISVYNRGTLIDPQWEVYGHVRPGVNDIIKGGFRTKSEVLEYAHSLPWDAPVIIGEGERITAIVDRLSGERRQNG